MATDLLQVRVLGSRRAIAALDYAQLVYLLVNIRSASPADVEHPPLNLCLVIDRSTSMKGERLERVKGAASLLIEKLGTEDAISVVTFSDRAEVVLPSSHLENKPALIGRIRSIMASGGTEIYQGLKAGVTELTKIQLLGKTNHLILLTDGHTYGDDEACLSLAQKIASKGIGLSAFGIGSDWNDQFLDRMVSASGGQSAFIESANQVFEFLQKRIHGLGLVYAQNLRLGLDFPMGVTLKTGFKVSPFAQPLSPDSDYYRLGAVEGQTPLSVLLEFTVEPQLPGRTINLPLYLTSDILAHNVQNYVSKQDYELSVVTDEPRFNPPKALMDAVQALNFYRLNERVWEEVEDGDLTQATTRMRRLTTRLLEAGHTQLAQQAYAEAERLSNIGTLSLEGRKRLKYGTRSLLTQTINLENND
ncbi:MAG: VWA domain-containing protein [Candidatus Promineifilaceae bacterium]